MSCVDRGSMRAKVDSDAQHGRLVGVVATPTFFINGIPLSGAQPAATFEKIIEDELARKRQAEPRPCVRHHPAHAVPARACLHHSGIGDDGAWSSQLK